MTKIKWSLSGVGFLAILLLFVSPRLIGTGSPTLDRFVREYDSLDPTTQERVYFDYDQNGAVMMYRMRTGLSMPEATARLWRESYPQLKRYYRDHPEEWHKMIRGE